MYFFVLGSHPALSLAEIHAVTGKRGVASNEILLIEDESIDPQTLQDRLSGSVKIGRIVGELAKWNPDEVADLIGAYLLPSHDQGRIDFGISVYDGGNSRIANELAINAKRVGLEIKKKLKETGKPVRFVTSKERALPSVAVTTNHLLENGGEFVLIATHHAILIGQTATVQDFKAWSDRDFGRPARDAKSGMLPPKLARLMINLAGVDPARSVLLDPFCGSGTVLMEAELMEFKEVIGSDVSEKAIKDSKRNLDWLLSGEQKTAPSLTVSPVDALTVEPVDVIVTETYLGAPRSDTMHPKALKHEMAKLLELYKGSLLAMHKLLKTNGMAVIAFPAFRTKTDLVFLPLKKLIESAGFKIVNPG